RNDQITPTILMIQKTNNPNAFQSLALSGSPSTSLSLLSPRDAFNKSCVLETTITVRMRKSRAKIPTISVILLYYFQSVIKCRDVNFLQGTDGFWHTY